MDDGLIVIYIVGFIGGLLLMASGFLFFTDETTAGAIIFTLIFGVVFFVVSHALAVHFGAGNIAKDNDESQKDLEVGAAYAVLAKSCVENGERCAYLIRHVGSGKVLAYYLPDNLPNPFVKMKDDSYAPVSK